MQNFAKSAIPPILTILVCVAAIVAAAAQKDKPKLATAHSSATAPMDEDKRILHALNRFTFGPRPGDPAEVRAMGLDKWFEQQLHPDKIDDGALETRLAPFRTLKMSTREMVEDFPPPQVVKMVENGRVSMPSDPGERAIYETRMLQYEEKQQTNAADSAANSGKGTQSEAKGDQEAAPNQTAGRLQPPESAIEADAATQLAALPAEKRYQEILKMKPEDRLNLLRSFKGPQLMRLVDGMEPRQREIVEAIVAPQMVVDGELTQAKLLRAIYGRRQLEEVMTDFWFNHFNVFVGKGPDRYMITAYERDVIRAHALGKFKDLLTATAKSPAMLFYLDNWQSIGPNSDLAKYGPGARRPVYAGRRPRMAPVPRPRNTPAAKNRPSGLNENYAREIMELHTLGVEGGYTQNDVTELAKVLTGWTIEEPQRGGDFKFNERAHEPGTKHVLGHKIGEHGEKEGMEMLEILAHHPSTARFISRKLAMRFVSDDPPQSLIDRMAKTFLKKDGDIREVLRTMFHSPEFLDPAAYRAKVKTPLEFVASSARASGVEINNAMPLVQALNRMGMQLYGMQPPTGYSMKAETWVNSSALINRMNFAVQLGTGRLPGSVVDPQPMLRGETPEDANAALAVMENSILAGDVSPQTHAVLQKQLDDPRVTQRRLDDPKKEPNYGMIAGLIMGSPEFQRR